MTFADILRRQILNPLRLGRVIPYLPHFVRLFYHLMNDPRVSFFTKLVPVLGVLFLLSPPGLELDFIPVLGELDVILVMYVALKLFVWLCPPEVVREHVARIAHGA